MRIEVRVSDAMKQALERWKSEAHFRWPHSVIIEGKEQRDFHPVTSCDFTPDPSRMERDQVDANSFTAVIVLQTHFLTDDIDLVATPRAILDQLCEIIAVLPNYALTADGEVIPPKL